MASTDNRQSRGAIVSAAFSKLTKLDVLEILVVLIALIGGIVLKYTGSISTQDFTTILTVVFGYAFVKDRVASK